jgi:uncharacterized protein (DUF983 family)
VVRCGDAGLAYTCRLILVDGLEEQPNDLVSAISVLRFSEVSWVLYLAMEAFDASDVWVHLLVGGFFFFLEKSRLTDGAFNARSIKMQL